MADTYALYVSSVPGFVVERFGSRGVYIGVRREAHGWTWLEDEVVGLTAGEVARYRREYEGSIRRGELLQRTPDDYEAYASATHPPDTNLEPEQPAREET